MTKKLTHTQWLFRLFALGLTILPPITYGEEVKLFQNPPSAEEMGKLLFPAKAAKPKTRSLAFSPVETQSAPKESIAIALPIQFDFNSATIRDDAKPFLDEIGRMLTMAQFRGERLLIEGHTDAIGPESSNDWLSRQRAKAVKQYLVSHFGIAPDRLRVVGRGEHRPLPGKNPNDPLNRRVELHRIN
ncbi:OmpA-OmpF porin, OOP family [Methylomarinovum caldicuralii]|uniref:OmpA-OmpF porin, OOP family n=1 Tax=Methylomarinovum caldicuralii TaxID=438856 RepID=A0AAU9BPZ8_9GAMM|nr:OmpA family protein [Methylomarinovum caldicuralii]BCX80808.1 OmpA-OmpF porin, OOP family [Methylomarinovum caldicuralii]